MLALSEATQRFHGNCRKQIALVAGDSNHAEERQGKPIKLQKKLKTPEVEFAMIYFMGRLAYE